MDDSISRQAAIDEIEDTSFDTYGDYVRAWNLIDDLPSAQAEITDEQAIEHLQDTGWMQNHDHEMYMMGIRDALGDDSESYDALIPKVGRWTYHSNPSFGINPEDAYCSRCGFHVCASDVEFDDYKYCPNCGVKMDESNR